MNHFPVPLLFRAQVRLHVAPLPHSRAIICRVGTLKLCVKAAGRTQSLLSELIIRLCRLCLTEIDIRVNLFQICWPCRREVPGPNLSPAMARQTVSILSKHVKNGSNYHCCSHICISQSDKLLTVCDILTVSRSAAEPQQTHLTRRLDFATSKTAVFTSKRKKSKPN